MKKGCVRNLLDKSYIILKQLPSLKIFFGSFAIPILMSWSDSLMFNQNLIESKLYYMHSFLYFTPIYECFSFYGHEIPSFYFSFSGCFPRIIDAAIKNKIARKFYLIHILARTDDKLSVANYMKSSLSKTT